jgi:C_GCAxxG_C_C family probable redox protein
MNRIEKTLDLHRNKGLNCSQAILSAFGADLGMTERYALVLGRPWAGGIGHLAQTCGYLTGAVLLLSEAFDDENEDKARQMTDQAVNALFKRFKKRRQSTLCRDLLGADMTTVEGVEKILKENMVGKICHCDGGIGHDAAKILDDLLTSQLIK